MDTNRQPKQALQYKSKGRRNIGRPTKRWRDKFILRIKEKETRLTLQENDEEDDDDNPKERWKDQLHFEDQGTRNKTNTSGI